MYFLRFRIRSLFAAILLAITQTLAATVGASPGSTVNSHPAKTQSTFPVQDNPSLLDAMTLSDPELNGLLDHAVTALRHRIESGPPFKIKERLAHLARLEKLVKEASIEITEKYRQILEAYRIELDYAKSVFAYSDLLQLDAEERLVDFLCVGRLALYYQTMDGHKSGIWRGDQKRWQPLSSEDNEAVAQGLRTARKIDPPQLIVLPMFGPASTPAQDPQPRVSIESPAQLIRKASLDSPTSSESREAFYTTLRANIENLKPYYQQPILSIDKSIDKALIDHLTDINHIPTVNELSQLFVNLQKLIDTQGRVSTLRAPVYAPNGQKADKNILRIGGFSMIAEGRYLSYSNEAGKLMELPRQPSSNLLELARDFTQANADSLALVAIDPSAGETLQLLVQIPNFKERLDQGGMIGYLILILGGLAYGISGFRFIELSVIGRRMRSQSNSTEILPDNPLGRVLARLNQSKSNDQEVLYLTVEEAIMAEQTQLERHLTLLKLVAAIAPMLGLLGTVTGMIKTFQVIALHGSGDPKLMSGGISEALVTTVEGLVIAIPILLLHTLLVTKSRNLGIQLEAHASRALAQRLDRTA
jgi:biopolymer transport protein ExbB